MKLPCYFIDDLVVTPDGEVVERSPLMLGQQPRPGLLPEAVSNLVGVAPDRVLVVTGETPVVVLGTVVVDRSTELVHESRVGHVGSSHRPVGDDHTRWVDGQFALAKPELGLSNWANGRLFGRGAILTGDSVYTVRTRYVSLGPGSG